MDQNNGPDAKISIEDARTLLTIDLEENPLLLIRISLRDPTLHMGTTIRIVEDPMINAQINHFTGTMETDLVTDPSTIRTGTGKTKETFLVLHRLKGETSHKINHIANQEVINPTGLPPADLRIDPRRVSHLTNKSSHKRSIRLHLNWFASPQPTKPLTIYQTSLR